MAKLRKEMIGAVQTGTLFGNRAISGAVDLGAQDLGLLYMDGKVRHRPTTFMGAQDLTWPFSSPNCTTTKKSESVLQPRHCSVRISII